MLPTTLQEAELPIEVLLENAGRQLMRVLQNVEQVLAAVASAPLLRGEQVRTRGAVREHRPVPAGE